MIASLTRGFVDLGQTVDLVLVRADGPHLARIPPEARRIHLGASHGLTALPALPGEGDEDGKAARVAVQSHKRV